MSVELPRVTVFRDVEADVDQSVSFECEVVGPQDFLVSFQEVSEKYGQPQQEIVPSGMQMRVPLNCTSPSFDRSLDTLCGQFVDCFATYR